MAVTSDGTVAGDPAQFSVSLAGVGGGVSRLFLGDQPTLEGATEITASGQAKVTLPLFDSEGGQLLVNNIPNLNLTVDLTGDSTQPNVDSFYNLPAFNIR